MAAFKFVCPACYKQLSSANPLPVGRRVRCSRCNTEFRIGDETVAASPPPPEAPPDELYDQVPAEESGPWDWPPDVPAAADVPFEPVHEGAYEPVAAAADEPAPVAEPVAAPGPAGEPGERGQEKRPVRRSGPLPQVVLVGLAVAGLMAGVVLLLYALIPRGSRETGAATKPAAEPPPDREAPLYLDPELPVWEAEPALVDLLGPETPVPDADVFRFRPPRGYAYGHESTGRLSWHGWTGPVRDDGSRPWLGLTILEPAREGHRRPGVEDTLDQFLDDFKATQRSAFPEVAYTAVEKGQMHLLGALRTNLTLHNPTTGVTLRGFVYLVTDGPNRFVFVYRDQAPHDEASRKFAEASVLTLHK
jgi:hypothetical protein